MSASSFLSSVHVIQGRAGPVYLVENAGTITVIDIAFPSDARAVLKYVQNELDRDVNGIKLLIFTHAHFDHVNGADYLVERTGACIAAHADARKYLTGMKAVPVTSLLSYIGFLVFLAKNNFPRPSLADIFIMPRVGIPGIKKGIKTAVEMWLEDGGSVPGFPGWEVIHTPGHTDDSICLYNFEEKILFSGDTIINDQGILKLNRLLVWNGTALEKSFKKLLQLPVDCLLPGWGQPVIGNDVLKDIR